ncbi:MAG: aldehyde dehydrogenase [Candidatus Thiodiazotropha sp.]|jgi:sugar phosphate permease
MANSAFFAVLIVLILGVLYVMKGSDNPPETGYNQTPKQYIELVEQKKAARQAAEAMQQSLQQSTEKSDAALKAIETQR